MYSAKYIRKKIKEIDPSKIKVLVQDGYYDGLIGGIIELNGKKYYTYMFDHNHTQHGYWYRGYAVHEMDKEDIEILYLREALWIYSRLTEFIDSEDIEDLYYNPIRLWKHRFIAQRYRNKRPVFWYKE